MPEGSEWKDGKYDAIFAPTLMSDDEEEVDENGKRTRRYLSHAPTYRSETASIFTADIMILLTDTPFFQVIHLLAAVDAMPDLNTISRYVHRIKGDPVDVPPKAAQKLKLRARRWMVRVEWLAEDKNKQYDVPSRIAENG